VPTGFEDGIDGSMGRQQVGEGLADLGPLESRFLIVGAALEVGRPVVLAIELSMDRVIECFFVSEARMALSNNERTGNLSPSAGKAADPVKTRADSAPGAAERGWLLLASSSRFFLGRDRGSEVEG
jgi:hypothetical protein